MGLKVVTASHQEVASIWAAFVRVCLETSQEKACLSQGDEKVVLVGVERDSKSAKYWPAQIPKEKYSKRRKDEPDSF